MANVLEATDGDIGRLSDVLFDDRDWIVRYLVAKTANWTPRRQVLVSPIFLDEPDWMAQRFPVQFSRHQIEHSPPLDEQAPVSRQYETDYHQYFALPFYWLHPDHDEAFPAPPDAGHAVASPAIPTIEAQTHEDGHIRSANDVCGYRITGCDGDVGQVEDFLVDDISWAVSYLVVDARRLLPGRRLLLSPRWLKSIGWMDRSITVDLNREWIRAGPEYDPSRPVSPHYEKTLYDYYGRPNFQQ